MGYKFRKRTYRASRFWKMEPIGEVYSRNYFQKQVYSIILEGISPFKYIQVFPRTLQTLPFSQRLTHNSFITSSFSQRISKNNILTMCLITPFSKRFPHVFHATSFSHRLSHIVFLTTSKPQLLSHNVFLATSFSRLARNVFLTTSFSRLARNVFLTTSFSQRLS